MEMRLDNGDYVPDGMGGFKRVEGISETAQRVLYKLKARKGGFALLPDLGSLLYTLGREKTGARQAAAEQYVKEALAGENAAVRNITVTEADDGLMVRLEVAEDGEERELSLDMRGGSL